ncbi:type II toxin-antitoxin system RelE/ParE family toxin [Marinomonas algarum]|uniref:Type II toxin-antitoxin system RelE/ParE family toxin n=1 Tax=Marinomonas algarum TaxID=2883105 RepID=A0A9X1LFX7_9GAMM|nr:type II toxin-antitoxin system RelE/ParE family toxin [Marinomonas algarum]MCB5163186.1 type II toxin-antitoxin system RelE/ParE family toxin [Marinomonas algarum]
MKEFKFVNDAALKEFKKLPKDVQLQFATSINAVAQGERPLVEFEPIGKSVGKGAIELKVNGSPAFRSIYCAKYNDTVFILHSFTKTTNGVDKKAMKTAKSRYKLMIDQI